MAGLQCTSNQQPLISISPGDINNIFVLMVYHTAYSGNSLYRRFGKTSQSLPQGSKVGLLETSKMGPIMQSNIEPLKMGPIRCPETSVRFYHYKLGKFSQESCSVLSKALEVRCFNRLLPLVVRVGQFERRLVGFSLNIDIIRKFVCNLFQVWPKSGALCLLCLCNLFQVWPKSGALWLLCLCNLFQVWWKSVALWLLCLCNLFQVWPKSGALWLLCLCNLPSLVKIGSVVATMLM